MTSVNKLTLLMVARYLLIAVVAPLVTIQLWIATSTHWLRASIRNVREALGKAFAPQSILVFACGFLIFAVAPYYLLSDDEYSAGVAGSFTADGARRYQRADGFAGLGRNGRRNLDSQSRLGGRTGMKIALAIVAGVVLLLIMLTKRTGCWSSHYDRDPLPKLKTSDSGSRGVSAGRSRGNDRRHRSTDRPRPRRRQSSPRVSGSVSAGSTIKPFTASPLCAPE